MPLFTLNPLVDHRWEELVEIHPDASVFHHTGWIGALSDTYGYCPFVLTTCSPGSPLSEGIPFCELRSWITGKRAVSLPFSDHTEPLLLPDSHLDEYLDWMQKELLHKNWKYIELRPRQFVETPQRNFAMKDKFWLHIVDLNPPLSELFHNLHKNSIQRRIRKAEREQLKYERGCSEDLVDKFFRLQVITRRRHRLPPQPRAWFINLAKRMAGRMEIRVARKDRLPIAAIITLHHRNKVVYKYGCSDDKFHNFGAMPFLFWKLIEESKADGFTELDLGRTEIENSGLMRFKEELGATRWPLLYWRYPESTHGANEIQRYFPLAGRLFAILPGQVSCIIGRALYKHVG